MADRHPPGGRVARRLRLDDDEAGDYDTGSSQGGSRRPVLGPLAGARRRAPASSAADQASTGGRQAPSATEAQRGVDDAGGVREAKPGASGRPAALRLPHAESGSGEEAPAGAGRETLPSRRPGRGASTGASSTREQREQPADVRASDSRFLHSPDSRRPHALPEQKYSSEEKLADVDLDTRTISVHDKARLVASSAAFNTDFGAAPPPTAAGSLYVEAPSTGVFQRRILGQARGMAAPRSMGQTDATGPVRGEEPSSQASSPVGQVKPFSAFWLEGLEALFLLVQGLLSGISLINVVVAQQFDDDADFVVNYANVAGPVRFGVNVLTTLALLGSIHVLTRFGSVDATRQFTPAQSDSGVTAEDPSQLLDYDGDGDVDDDDVAANAAAMGGGARSTMLLKAALYSNANAGRVRWYARCMVGAYALAMLALLAAFPAYNTLASVAGRGRAAPTYADALDDVGTWRALAGLHLLGALVGWVFAALSQRVNVERGRELVVDHLKTMEGSKRLRRRLGHLLGETRGDMSVDQLRKLKDVQSALADATQASIDTVMRTEVRRAAREAGAAEGERKA